MKLNKLDHTLGAGFMILVVFLALISVGDGRTADTTVIHLTERNGYFESRETFEDPRAGDYEFVVTNASGKRVGFRLKNVKTGQNLAHGMIDEGKTRTFRVYLDPGVYAYRCGTNPTPWYEFTAVR